MWNLRGRILHLTQASAVRNLPPAPGREAWPHSTCYINRETLNTLTTSPVRAQHQKHNQPVREALCCSRKTHTHKKRKSRMKVDFKNEVRGEVCCCCCGVTAAAERLKSAEVKCVETLEGLSAPQWAPDWRNSILFLARSLTLSLSLCVCVCVCVCKGRLPSNNPELEFYQKDLDLGGMDRSYWLMWTHVGGDDEMKANLDGCGTNY